VQAEPVWSNLDRGREAIDLATARCRKARTASDHRGDSDGDVIDSSSPPHHDAGAREKLSHRVIGERQAPVGTHPDCQMVADVEVDGAVGLRAEV
jgi:hypothetical protein